MHDATKSCMDKRTIQGTRWTNQFWVTEKKTSLTCSQILHRKQTLRNDVLTADRSPIFRICFGFWNSGGSGGLSSPHCWELGPLRVHQGFSFGMLWGSIHSDRSPVSSEPAKKWSCWRTRWRKVGRRCLCVVDWWGVSAFRGPGEEGLSVENSETDV